MCDTKKHLPDISAPAAPGPAAPAATADPPAEAAVSPVKEKPAKTGRGEKNK